MVHVTEGGASHPATIAGGRIILAVTVLALAVMAGEGAGVGLLR